ncbi:MAG TPA: MFS transporter [Streptosporangiaceae bacterium]|nr:MFS transporter [Streptosporangiaceae bacterium]
MTRPARGWAYAAIGFLFVAVMMATTEPTPLYTFWERSYGFGAIVTTLVFATYAIGVIAALLFAGRDSDVDGRRPVLAACVGCSALSSILFLLANGLALLFIARLVSGLSAGLAASAATATLVDLGGATPLWSRVVPGAVNLLGLGAGPIVAGALAETSSDPTRLPFEVHLAVLIVAAVLALGLAYRDRAERTGPMVIVHRPALGLPSAGRGTFAAAALGGFTTFALLGLFTALVPTFLEKVIGQHHPWVIGASVSLLFAAAVLTQLVLRGLQPHTAIELGLAVLIVGLALLTWSLDIASYPLFLAGTVISGVAIGAAFSGGLATALSVAGEGERGRVSSLFFFIAYVGITIPVIGAGFGVAGIGILATFIVVGAVLAVFDLAALTYLRREDQPRTNGSS